LRLRNAIIGKRAKFARKQPFGPDFGSDAFFAECHAESAGK
jgi:hypothetical protein